MTDLTRAGAPVWRRELVDWMFTEAGQSDWHPATAPGCVHTDLLGNGLIEDPFFRDNESRLQWIEERDWVYRAELHLDAEQLRCDGVELHFEGLDTFAEVSVNGQSVLFADNMYRCWVVDVGSAVSPGINQIEILFRSAVAQGLVRRRQHGVSLPAINDQAEPGRRVSPFVRKAPYQFGWDWGPRLVTCGIWKPAALVGWTGARLRDVHVRQRQLDDERAELDVTIRAAVTSIASVEAIVTCEDEPGLRVSGPLTPTEGSTGGNIRLPLEIPSPERWWPHGLGAQRLYTLRVDLVRGADLLDSRTLRIGLRTVALDRSPDPSGSRFRFVVNGIPLFMRGANWIPADSFPSRVSEERTDWLLGSATAAGMNMLRVWGGGLYEDDRFYDRCDELGILVWQDFMFSCSMYPADEDFLRSVEHEATDNVRRLRNHPSLVLWCGNNEMEWGWQAWGWKWKYPGAVWEDYERLFHELLPRVCAAEDPDRPYWPSSPSSGDRRGSANHQDHGDMHYWGVWHSKEPFETYLDQQPRFMSEFGFQAFPGLRTVSTYALPEDQDIESPVMRAHQRHPEGNHLIWTYMARHYPVPRDFPSFLYVSQVLQAEGMRIGTEHLRRIRDRCAGALYWQLNDCWPVASWSSIDYYGRWKALHYAACRFFADVLVCVAEDGNAMTVYIVSDSAGPIDGRLSIELRDFTGAVLRTHLVRCRLEPGTVEPLARFDRRDLVDDATAARRYLRAELMLLQGARPSGSGPAVCRTFFEPPKALALPRPTLSVAGSVNGTTAALTVGTDVLARHVFLEHPAIDGHFSDNFFDLDAGERREVLFSSWSGNLPAGFVEEIRVRSLVEAF